MKETEAEADRHFSNREEALAAYHFLYDEWWKVYRSTLGGREGSIEEVGLFLDAKREVDQVREMILSQFGKINPKHPDCQTCLNNSVFGGPGHDTSPYCRSGRNPHCTCDACF